MKRTQKSKSNKDKKGRGQVKKKVTFPLTTIMGIVIPVDWDERGIVVSAAISTYDEKEYLIDMEDKGKELMAHMRQEVEVSGFVKDDDRNVITVTQFTVTKDMGAKF